MPLIKFGDLGFGVSLVIGDWFLGVSEASTIQRCLEINIVTVRLAEQSRLMKQSEPLK
jgi:hypothetical protein